MDILVCKRHYAAIVELQTARNPAIVEDGNSDQRLNAATTALLDVKEKLGIHIDAAQDLAGAQARSAQRLLHGKFCGRWRHAT